MNNLFKIAILAIGLSSLATEANAQFGKNLLNRVKREAQNKVEQKVNNAVDKAVDKAVDAVLENPKEVKTKEESTTVGENAQEANAQEANAQPLSTVPANVAEAEDNAKVAKAKYEQLVANARKAISDDNFAYFEAKDRKAELNSAAQEAGVTSTADIVIEINKYMKSFNEPQTNVKPANNGHKTNASTSSANRSNSSNSSANRSTSSSNSNSSSNNDPFAGKRPSNLGTSSGRVHDGKSTTFGEVSSNGEIKYKGSFVCKIDSKGVIYDRSNKVIGQVDRDGYIYKLTSGGRYDKIGRFDYNGNVYDGSSRVGQITSEIKDGSGKSLTNVLPYGVNKLHIGVMMFLNRRF